MCPLQMVVETGAVGKSYNYTPAVGRVSTPVIDTRDDQQKAGDFLDNVTGKIIPSVLKWSPVYAWTYDKISKGVDALKGGATTADIIRGLGKASNINSGGRPIKNRK